MRPRRGRACDSAASRSRSLGDDAERGSGIEVVDVTADEAARDARAPAGLEDCVQTLAWSIRNGHQDLVRRCASEGPADLVEAPDDGDALDPTPAQHRIVVDERDDALARCLSQLAQEASAAPARADDQVAVLLAASDDGADHA